MELKDYSIEELRAEIKRRSELSIEQKAKAYDEAIKRVENINTGKCKTTFMFTSGLFEYIFPELQESEGEKIRKELLAWLKSIDRQTLPIDRYNAAIDWLEKQGEKKPNPYSGISFEYNGHIWGMCARDNGVDILLDKQLFNHLEKHGEQKSWSEDDERMFNSALWHVKNSCGNGGKNSGEFEVYNWLKLLKDRVQTQPNQEWSEKDKERIEQICDDLKSGMINFYANEVVKGLHYKEIIESNIEWLKSLRPQSTWKPSDEQIEALEYFIVYHNDSTNYAKDLEELRLQLKKLRGSNSYE